MLHRRSLLRHIDLFLKIASGSISLDEAYAILEIPSDATSSEIKRALNKIKVINNPDKFIQDGEAEVERHKLIIQRAEEAFSVIENDRNYNPNDPDLISKETDKLKQSMLFSPPKLLYDEWYVSHYSTNLDSIKNGFVQRTYGVSFARQPSERISAPTYQDVDGQAGIVFATVSGYGLDYDRPEHKKFIDDVYDWVSNNNIKATQNVVFNYLKSLGVDWINAWNGIGRSRELHVLNTFTIKITRILPVSSHFKLRKMQRPNWFGEQKERLNKIKI